MAFHFSLATLLKLRQAIEKQREMQLLEARGKVLRIEQEIESVKQESAEVAAQALAAMTQGVPAAELQFASMRRERLANLRKKFDNELIAAEAVCRERSTALQAAQREKEILASLREAQFAQYQLERKRRDQQMADDLFLGRKFSRGSRSE